jgi:hypothetical protein
MSRGVTEALSAMLPSPTQTSFLRCCLDGGESLGEAWRGWQVCVPDTPRWLQSEGRPLRGHLPRLHANLVDNDVPIPAGLEPYLKMATVRERRRWTSWAESAGAALAALSAAEVEVTLLAGAAVPAITGEPPHLRHCHDLDLWVLPRAVDAAVQALVEAGHTVAAVDADTARLVGPAGLPLLLHTQLLPGDDVRLPETELWARRAERQLLGQPIHVLAASDLFVHVSALASTWARRPHANWAVDAHRVGVEIDDRGWRAVHELIEVAGLALPLSVLVGYVRRELAAAVPGWLTDALDASAQTASAVAQRRALAGARDGVPGGFRSMVRRTTPRSTMEVARLVLLPGRRARDR